MNTNRRRPCQAETVTLRSVPSSSSSAVGCSVDPLSLPSVQPLICSPDWNVSGCLGQTVPTRHSGSSSSWVTCLHQGLEASGSLTALLRPTRLDWTAAMNQSKVDIEPFEYSYYDYSDWYSDNAEPTKPPKEWVSDDRPITLLLVLNIDHWEFVLVDQWRVTGWRRLAVCFFSEWCSLQGDNDTWSQKMFTWTQ